MLFEFVFLVIYAGVMHSFGGIDERREWCQSIKAVEMQQCLDKGVNYLEKEREHGEYHTN